MSAALARLVREKRERQRHKEKLVLIARKAKVLAEEAFGLGEHQVGAKLHDAVEYIYRVLSVREP